MPPLTEPVLPPGTLASRPQPAMGGEGLAIRPWRPDDVETLVVAYSDPQIQQWHARSLTPAEAKEWVAARGVAWTNEAGADWAVEARSAVVGRVSLKRIDLAEGIGEVGYWVLPQARGSGVASRAVRALSEWALGELGLHRLELMHSTRNAISCHVAARAGFGVEGTKRAEALHPDGWHDMHMHARLAGDPPVQPNASG